MDMSRWIKTLFIILVPSLIILGAISHVYLQNRDHGNGNELEASDVVDVLDEAMGLYATGRAGGITSGKISKTSINGTHTRVDNLIDDYRLVIPSTWKVDDKDIDHVVHFRYRDMKLTVLRQLLNTSFELPGNYINYSYYRVEQEYGPIDLVSRDLRTIGNRSFHFIEYRRDPIQNITGDLFHYFHYNIVEDEETVFSFMLKTNEASLKRSKREVETSLLSFSQIHPRNLTENGKIPGPEVQSISLEGRSMNLNVGAEKKVMGIFHKPHDDYWIEVEDLESELDTEFHFFMDYFNFKTSYTDAEDYIHKHYEEGNIMLITLQPYVSSHGKEYDGNVVLFDMLNGQYDGFLLDWAKGLKDLGEPVFLRLGNEMNGDWTQWCSWFYGLDPDLFIMAWARVHTIFDLAGADNVQFVWNPHDRTYPDYDWQAQYLYYPGDDMVDWIGLTAYNNGETRETERWRDFQECYGDLYDDYMRRFSSKPFMITEFACNEIGGDKAAWIEEGLRSLFDGYPNIWMAVWWNGVDDTWIYDIDSSEQSLEAFRKAMDHPAVIEDPVTIED